MEKNNWETLKYKQIIFTFNTFIEDTDILLCETSSHSI